MKDHVTGSVDWSSFEQPEWNQPGTVESALNALWQLREPEAFGEHYNRILYCLGNNHAGHFFLLRFQRLMPSQKSSGMEHTFRGAVVPLKSSSMC